MGYREDEWMFYRSRDCCFIEIGVGGCFIKIKKRMDGVHKQDKQGWELCRNRGG